MRDVCGSSRWERDRALMLERRWMVKVRDFETYGGAALLLMSQCQQGSNRASIIDNVLTCPCVLLRCLPRFRLVWCRTCGLCGIFSAITCQHTLRDSESIPMDKAADSSACWSVGKEKRMGTYAVVVAVAVAVAVVVL
jgi:hypothetical protein